MSKSFIILSCFLAISQLGNVSHALDNVPASTRNYELSNSHEEPMVNSDEDDSNRKTGTTWFLLLLKNAKENETSIEEETEDDNEQINGGQKTKRCMALNLLRKTGLISMPRDARKNLSRFAEKSINDNVQNLNDGKSYFRLASRKDTDIILKSLLKSRSSKGEDNDPIVSKSQDQDPIILVSQDLMKSGNQKPKKYVCYCIEDNCVTKKPKQHSRPNAMRTTIERNILANNRYSTNEKNRRISDLVSSQQQDLGAAHNLYCPPGAVLVEESDYSQYSDRKHHSHKRRPVKKCLPIIMPYESEAESIGQPMRINFPFAGNRKFNGRVYKVDGTLPFVQKLQTFIKHHEAPGEVPCVEKVSPVNNVLGVEDYYSNNQKDVDRYAQVPMAQNLVHPSPYVLHTQHSQYPQYSDSLVGDSQIPSKPVDQPYKGHQEPSYEGTVRRRPFLDTEECFKKFGPSICAVLETPIPSGNSPKIMENHEEEHEESTIGSQWEKEMHTTTELPSRKINKWNYPTNAHDNDKIAKNYLHQKEAGEAAIEEDKKKVSHTGRYSQSRIPTKPEEYHDIPRQYFSGQPINIKNQPSYNLPRITISNDKIVGSTDNTPTYFDDHGNFHEPNSLIRLSDPNNMEYLRPTANPGESETEDYYDVTEEAREDELRKTPSVGRVSKFPQLASTSISSPQYREYTTKPTGKDVSPSLSEDTSEVIAQYVSTPHGSSSRYGTSEDQYSENTFHREHDRNVDEVTKYYTTRAGERVGIAKQHSIQGSLSYDEKRLESSTKSPNTVFMKMEEPSSNYEPTISTENLKGNRFQGSQRITTVYPVIDNENHTLSASPRTQSSNNRIDDKNAVPSADLYYSIQPEQTVANVAPTFATKMASPQSPVGMIELAPINNYSKSGFVSSSTSRSDNQYPTSHVAMKNVGYDTTPLLGISKPGQRKFTVTSHPAQNNVEVKTISSWPKKIEDTNIEDNQGENPSTTHYLARSEIADIDKYSSTQKSSHVQYIGSPQLTNYERTTDKFDTPFYGANEPTTENVIATMKHTDYLRKPVGRPGNQYTTPYIQNLPLENIESASEHTLDNDLSKKVTNHYSPVPSRNWNYSSQSGKKMTSFIDQEISTTDRGAHKQFVESHRSFADGIITTSRSDQLNKPTSLLGTIHSPTAAEGFQKSTQQPSKMSSEYNLYSSQSERPLFIMNHRKSTQPEDLELGLPTADNNYSAEDGPKTYTTAESISSWPNEIKETNIEDNQGEQPSTTHYPARSEIADIDKYSSTQKSSHVQYIGSPQLTNYERTTDKFDTPFYGANEPTTENVIATMKHTDYLRKPVGRPGNQYTTPYIQNLPLENIESASEHTLDNDLSKKVTNHYSPVPSRNWDYSSQSGKKMTSFIDQETSATDRGAHKQSVESQGSFADGIITTSRSDQLNKPTSLLGTIHSPTAAEGFQKSTQQPSKMSSEYNLYSSQSERPLFIMNHRKSTQPEDLELGLPTADNNYSAEDGPKIYTTAESISSWPNEIKETNIEDNQGEQPSTTHYPARSEIADIDKYSSTQKSSHVQYIGSPQLTNYERTTDKFDTPFYGANEPTTENVIATMKHTDYLRKPVGRPGNQYTTPYIQNLPLENIESASEHTLDNDLSKKVTNHYSPVPSRNWNYSSQSGKKMTSFIDQEISTTDRGAHKQFVESHRSFADGIITTSRSDQLNKPASLLGTIHSPTAAEGFQKSTQQPSKMSSEYNLYSSQSERPLFIMNHRKSTQPEDLELGLPTADNNYSAEDGPKTYTTAESISSWPNEIKETNIEDNQGEQPSTTHYLARSEIADIDKYSSTQKSSHVQYIGSPQLTNYERTTDKFDTPFYGAKEPTTENVIATMKHTDYLRKPVGRPGNQYTTSYIQDLPLENIESASEHTLDNDLSKKVTNHYSPVPSRNWDYSSQSGKKMTSFIDQETSTTDRGAHKQFVESHRSFADGIITTSRSDQLNKPTSLLGTIHSPTAAEGFQKSTQQPSKMSSEYNLYSSQSERPLFIMNHRKTMQPEDLELGLSTDNNYSAEDISKTYTTAESILGESTTAETETHKLEKNRDGKSRNPSKESHQLITTPSKYDNSKEVKRPLETTLSFENNSDMKEGFNGYVASNSFDDTVEEVTSSDSYYEEKDPKNYNDFSSTSSDDSTVTDNNETKDINSSTVADEEVGVANLPKTTNALSINNSKHYMRYHNGVVEESTPKETTLNDEVIMETQSYKEDDNDFSPMIQTINGDMPHLYPAKNYEEKDLPTNYYETVSPQSKDDITRISKDEFENPSDTPYSSTPMSVTHDVRNPSTFSDILKSENVVHDKSPTEGRSNDYSTNQYSQNTPETRIQNPVKDNDKSNAVFEQKTLASQRHIVSNTLPTMITLNKNSSAASKKKEKLLTISNKLFGKTDGTQPMIPYDIVGDTPSKENLSTKIEDDVSPTQPNDCTESLAKPEPSFNTDVEENALRDVNRLNNHKITQPSYSVTEFSKFKEFTPSSDLIRDALTPTMTMDDEAEATAILTTETINQRNDISKKDSSLKHFTGSYDRIDNVQKGKMKLSATRMSTTPETNDENAFEPIGTKNELPDAEYMDTSDCSSLEHSQDTEYSPYPCEPMSSSPTVGNTPSSRSFAVSENLTLPTLKQVPSSTSKNKESVEKALGSDSTTSIDETELLGLFSGAKSEDKVQKGIMDLSATRMSTTPETNDENAFEPIGTKNELPDAEYMDTSDCSSLEHSQDTEYSPYPCEPMSSSPTVGNTPSSRSFAVSEDLTLPTLKQVPSSTSKTKESVEKALGSDSTTSIDETELLGLFSGAKSEDKVQKGIMKLSATRMSTTPETNDENAFEPIGTKNELPDAEYMDTSDCSSLEHSQATEYSPYPCEPPSSSPTVGNTPSSRSFAVSENLTLPTLKQVPSSTSKNKESVEKALGSDSTTSIDETELLGLFSGAKSEDKVQKGIMDLSATRMSTTPETNDENAFEPIGTKNELPDAEYMDTSDCSSLEHSQDTEYSPYPCEPMSSSPTVGNTPSSRSFAVSEDLTLPTLKQVPSSTSKNKESVEKALGSDSTTSIDETELLGLFSGAKSEDKVQKGIMELSATRMSTTPETNDENAFEPIGTKNELPDAEYMDTSDCSSLEDSQDTEYSPYPEEEVSEEDLQSLSTLGPMPKMSDKKTPSGSLKNIPIIPVIERVFKNGQWSDKQTVLGITNEPFDYKLSPSTTAMSNDDSELRTSSSNHKTSTINASNLKVTTDAVDYAFLGESEEMEDQCSAPDVGEVNGNVGIEKILESVDATATKQNIEHEADPENAPIKYYSPNDRILTYIKNHRTPEGKTDSTFHSSDTNKGTEHRPSPDMQINEFSTTGSVVEVEHATVFDSDEVPDALEETAEIEESGERITSGDQSTTQTHRQKFTKIPKYYDSSQEATALTRGLLGAAKSRGKIQHLQENMKGSSNFVTPDSDPTYFGKLTLNSGNPSEDRISDLTNTDLFYIGDGVKIPLTIRRMPDGSYALSISEKICERFINRKCPCCVPNEGDIVEESRKPNVDDGVEDETTSERNSYDLGSFGPTESSEYESESKRRYVRSTSGSDIITTKISPVKSFVKKYNMTLNLVTDHIPQQSLTIDEKEIQEIGNTRRNKRLGSFRDTKIMNLFDNNNQLRRDDSEEQMQITDDNSEVISKESNFIRRSESSYDKDINSFVQDLLHIRDVPENKRTEIVVNALDGLINSASVKNLIPTGHQSVTEFIAEDSTEDQSQWEDSSVDDLRDVENKIAGYGYQKDNPILERIRFIKDNQHGHGQYKYQRNIDHHARGKMNILKTVLHWLREVFLEAKGNNKN